MTIVADHYSITGFVPGILMAALGVLVCTAFIAAYRSGSPRLVRAAALALLIAAAYGFAATGQGTALAGSVLLVALAWVPRASRAGR